MEFTQKDREFLMRLAKCLSDVKVRVKSLEKQATPQFTPEAVLSPLQPDFGTEDEVTEESETHFVNIKFAKGASQAIQKEIFARSMCNALKQICEMNGIEQLSIQIDNVK